ncbi:MAG: cytochrome c biogenesis protein CcdA [Pseudonocardiales bacterium]|nr:cytochrome c biogenesis protein CcdA [Pseudonocardiales bacterium]
MDIGSLGFAVAAGSVAALNPCGFAMRPAYLMLVVAGDSDGAPRRLVAVGRALAATVVMAAGFVVVFGAFGLLVGPVVAAVQRYLPVVTVIVGVGVIALGVWMVAGHELTVLVPKPGRGAPTARLGSMFGYGLAYAVVSLSCTIGPFLAVTSAGVRDGSIAGTVGAYLGYAGGMALVVGVLATGVALLGAEAATRTRRLLPYVNRAGGGLLVLVGAYVGYYGWYELRLAGSDADVGDPVITAAATVQQTLIGWVDSVGVLPLLAALVGLVVVAVVLTRRARHNRAT